MTKKTLLACWKFGLGKAGERLEETREAVKALCELVEEPKDTLACLRYFCAKDSGNAGYSLAREPEFPKPAGNKFIALLPVGTMRLDYPPHISGSGD